MKMCSVSQVDEIAKVVQNLKKFTDVSGDFVGKRVASLGMKILTYLIYFVKIGFYQ